MVSFMANQLDTAFQALSDPTRRAVLERLTTGPAAVSELAAPFDMALPTFLRHLKVLEASGLVRSEKTGRVRTVHIEAAPLSRMQDWIALQKRTWERRADRLKALAESLPKE